MEVTGEKRKLKAIREKRKAHKKELELIQRELVKKITLKESQKKNYWINKQNKDHLIDLNERDIERVKEYFDSLDEDNSGGISIQELKFPMFTLSKAGIIN